MGLEPRAQKLTCIRNKAKSDIPGGLVLIPELILRQLAKLMLYRWKI